ncbi:MAG: ribosome small subunit-dependent GTPase A [Deltaproteobacteria bacterium]|nr:ribosome small subunit-dependent GTPase A [Deltaproteobacteria bacterium]
MGYRKREDFLDRVAKREKRRPGAGSAGPLETARVLANHGIRCLVRTESGDERLLPISRKLTAVAGDLAEIDGERVHALRPRGRVLARADHKRTQIIAANVDRVVLVQAASQPPFREGLADRYQVFCAVMDLPLVLLVNKMDEPAPDVADRARAYEALGVEVLFASAKNGEGLETVAEKLSDGVSVLAGHSGVGKSSLMARLVPDHDIAVGDINEAIGRGRQTTTTARAYPFRDGYLVDTPGVREFSFAGVEPAQVAPAFDDIAERAAECKFRNCLHQEEPDCAVRGAAERGAISAERYASYLRILESLKAPGRS